MHSASLKQNVVRTFCRKIKNMKPCNLLIHVSGASALQHSISGNIKEITQLKDVEINVLKIMCDDLKNAGCDARGFDGFYIGYTIDQINKEFDLLRFGNDSILNIELKSDLKNSKQDVKEKLTKQLEKNYYYLKMTALDITLIVFVENDGFYLYDEKLNCIERISVQDVVNIIKKQEFDASVDPQKIFIPSNYLISPFNTTDAFIRGEYFLTQHQIEIKQRILHGKQEFVIHCLTANAGTGKTLLIYDIAKTLMSSGKNVLIIHCANLNNGQRKLNNEYGWNIRRAKSIKTLTKDSLKNYDYVIVDEAQRIYKSFLETLLSLTYELNIPIVFSYDVKQYLSGTEKTDIYEYVTQNHSEYKAVKHSLTNKIRTNKAIASFITNMFEIGSSNENVSYESVSVEFTDDINYLKEYSKELINNGWQPIKYTTSYFKKESLDQFADISSLNPHDVIGQEYSKVVLYLNEDFGYINSNKLTAENGYYDALGMVYQIATRVINELKIVVFNNIELYERLCRIKYKL